MDLGISRSRLRLPDMPTLRNEPPALNPAAAAQRGLLRAGGILLVAAGLGVRATGIARVGAAPFRPASSGRNSTSPPNLLPFRPIEPGQKLTTQPRRLSWRGLLAFALVGALDFFGAFGHGGMPEKFWCLFVGLPLLGIGMALLQAGFFGAAARYTAGEVAPVVGDSIEYLGARSSGVVRDLARQVAEGARDGTSPTVRQRLEQLELLRADGLIQPAEYESQRQRILSEI